MLHRHSTVDGLTDGHGRGELAVGRVETCLDEVLALWLGDERLELRGGEGIDETCLGHDKEQNLRASEGRQFVCLIDASDNERGVEDVEGNEERK